MINRFKCKVCGREFEYGDDDTGTPVGYSQNFCNSICDGMYYGLRKAVNRFKTLAGDIRRKGDEHGEADAGLAFEAAASSIERICEELMP